MKSVVFLLLILVSCSQLPTSHSDRLSILQGVTNSGSVEFSVMTRKGMSPRFELRTDTGEITAPEEMKTISRDFSDYVVHKLIFPRDPKRDYNLYAFEGEKILDQRLVGKGQINEDRLSVVVASCLDDHYPKNFGIWEEVRKRNPEYLLLIGDNVYADKTGKTSSIPEATPEILWNRYVETRLALPVYFQEKLIPVHALWDDHDYGANNSGRDFRYKEESRAVFEAFMAQDLSDDEWEKGLGVGGLLSLGAFNLYFLDGRSFRAPEKEGQHLGIDQTAWLEKKLTSENTPSLLIKGDQFFGGYHNFESFEGNHPAEFQSFAAKLKKITTPTVFVSGDRHLSEIMQFPRSLFGRPSFEITSSPLHAQLFTGNEETRNPWRVVANLRDANFTVIRNTAVGDHWFLDVENVNQKGEVVYRRELAVFIKDLQDNMNEVRKRRRQGTRRYRRSRGRRR